jgi:hypothetical protein
LHHSAHGFLRLLMIRIAQHFEQSSRNDLP